MANCRDRVGQVEKNEAAHNRVERLVGAPARDVALDKRDARLARRFGALTCDGEGLCRAIETDDRSVRANELGREASHVTKAGAQIEHPHPRDQARGLE